MNSTEIKNAIALFSVLFGGIFAAHGITISTAQWTSIATEASVALPALLSLGGTVYSIYSHWNMKKVPENSIAVARLVSSEPALHDQHAVGDHVEVGGQVAKVVGALLASLFIYGMLSHPAFAQGGLRLPKLKTPQEIGADVANALQKNAPQIAPGGLPACNLGLFSGLTLDNVFEAVTNCIGKTVSDATAPLLQDVNDAQTSAVAANDAVAQACYKPGLAILNAAKQISDAKDATGNDVPAHYSGVITVQQKFREFVMSGGIVACKALINSTAAMATTSAL